MGAKEWVTIYSILIGAIGSPLLIWLVKGVYESWQMKGTYINVMPATGIVNEIDFGYDGLADGVGFMITVRIMNTTDKLQALESITVLWKNVESKHLPYLKHLIDSRPRLKDFSTKRNSVEDFYKNIPGGKNTLLPVLLQPKGGSVYLQLTCTLGFYKRKNFFLLRQFYPPIKSEDEQEIRFGIQGGEAVIKAKVSGKIRSFPVTIWENETLETSKKKRIQN